MTTPKRSRAQTRPVPELEIEQQVQHAAVSHPVRPYKILPVLPANAPRLHRVGSIRMSLAQQFELWGLPTGIPPDTYYLSVLEFQGGRLATIYLNAKLGVPGLPRTNPGATPFWHSVGGEDPGILACLSDIVPSDCIVAYDITLI